jgi:hypothetical protein
MVMPKDSFHMQIQENVTENWREFLNNMEESLNILERGLSEASEMRDICTDEWCVATEHVIDDLSNWLFSISEPAGSPTEDSKKLRTLRRRLHDLYAKYKVTASDR